ncbi:MAG TPA: hypothetical protein VJ826_14640 [Candidatus Polarisedimenticolaceae bacterium]|nr:hypothetical protein [Candidatus Polarisedimenticolaceae bacterium]
MRLHQLILGLLAALALSASGCQKLDAPPPAQLPRTVTLDAIPADTGELFAVTTAPQWPSTAQLWFVKPDKSIAMIGVDMKTMRVINTSVLIPRR